jgi:hypothetical protein
VNFLREVNGLPPGPLLIEGGNFFKTTHIELRVNIPNSSQLSIGIGQTIMDRIQTLFYNFAPAPLVIELLTMVVIFANTDWYNSKGQQVAGALGFTTTLVEGDVYTTLE